MWKKIQLIVIKIMSLGYISRAEHVIDGSSFTTRLELEAKISDWIAESE
ncbi:hypothetical protein [Symbiopectobacterium sp. RP]